MRTERITREIESVAAKYPGTYAVDDPIGCIDLIIPQYPIPAGFTASTARVLVRIPALFPAEKLDLFWLSPSITRADGTGLANVMANGVPIANEQWTQISWHDNSPHDPNRITALAFVRSIRSWFAGQVGGG